MCQQIKQADIQVHWWNEDFYSWRLKGGGGGGGGGGGVSTGGFGGVMAPWGHL